MECLKWYEKVILGYSYLCKIVFEFGFLIVSTMQFGSKVGFTILIAWILWNLGGFILVNNVKKVENNNKSGNASDLIETLKKELERM
jgi:pheromone shutdown protein TraB